MIHYAESDNYLTLLAYSSLLSGLYSKPEEDLPVDYRTTDNMQRMALLKSLAEAKGCTLNQLVLSWMMHQKVKIIPIIAGSKVNQIEESIGACGVHLNEHEIMLMNKAGE